MKTVIDFHTHILPGIDDGSSCLKHSIQMLEQEMAQGIDRVVLTPHFYPNHDSPERFLRRRQRAVQELHQVLAERDDLPKVAVGAEIKFFDGISDCEYLSDMAISGTRCVLVEMPTTVWTERMLDELIGIRQKQGLIPIIAHIDRYISPFRTHGIPEKLAGLPVLVQANAEFFIRPFTRPTALKLLSAERIHLLGSDCHNLQTRTPNLAQAIDIIVRKLGKETIERINASQAYTAIKKKTVY